MEKGRLDPKEIEGLINAGDIDTILMVFPDQQGRFMGKRVTGDFFLNDVLARRVAHFFWSRVQQLNPLLQKRETETAVRVWEELVKRNAKLQSYAQPGNLIVDGGLERDFLNGGFDWRYSVKGPLQLSVDTSEFHGGNEALRMVFRGPAVSDAGIFEYIPVHPYTDYRFRAYTKSEDIESASGPRLTVLDAYSGESYVLTDDSLGTTGWRQQSADFSTGSKTSLLVVTVRRLPGNVLIKGKFWIDDLSLVKR